MTVFPNVEHDDQVDSTAQFLDWFKTPMPSWAFYELARQHWEAAPRRTKPQPIEPTFALGCMEWRLPSRRMNDR